MHFQMDSHLKARRLEEGDTVVLTRTLSIDMSNEYVCAVMGIVL